jgi:pentatricopeptide repeat protein
VDGATKALQLLNKMEAKNIKPPLRIYNSCIHGFAVRGMIDESERLLERLEELSEVNEGLRPDVLTCSTVLNAYLKYKGRVQGKPLEKRAEDLLDRMMRRYEATGDVQYRPNQYTFGTGKSVGCKIVSNSG